MTPPSEKSQGKRKAPPHAFKPGQSGNPGGVPGPKAIAKRTITAEIHKLLANLAVKTEDGQVLDGYEYMAAFLTNLLSNSKNNRTPAAVKVAAFKLLLQYTDGMPKQEHMISGTLGSYTASPEEQARIARELGFWVEDRKDAGGD